MRRELYDPPDVIEALREWQANCGPCALAAVLRVPVAEVRHLFPGFEQRRYTNPTHMKTALHLTGKQWNSIGKEQWPDYGLVFLQLRGPWEAPGAPVAAAYRHTHWVAVAVDGAEPLTADERPWVWVYDLNHGCWQPADYWEKETMPKVVTATPRATGWYSRSAIVVED